MRVLAFRPSRAYPDPDFDSSALQEQQTNPVWLIIGKSFVEAHPQPILSLGQPQPDRRLYNMAKMGEGDKRWLVEDLKDGTNVRLLRT